MENPYQSPAPSGADFGVAYSHGTLGESGMVRQVGVVAILMFVQAGFEIVMGLFLCAMGPIMWSTMSSMPAGPRQPGGAGPEEMAWILTAVYGGLGLLLLFAGGLKIVAGVKNLKYRSRGLGITALAFGMVTVFSCYCAPTGIALAIYGLIIYLNGDVATAFRLGSEGHSADQIRAAPRR